MQQVIEQITAAFPTYGYRRNVEQLHRQGWNINRKRVERIMHEGGWQARKRVLRRLTTDSTHQFPHYCNLVEHLDIVRPDQVWGYDITYIRL